MTSQLSISIGQGSEKGRKEINQDFHGICIPKNPLLSTKGIAIGLADGISSSDVSQHASEVAVTGFLEDYYCTPESWTVKTSVQRVLRATNSWLYVQSRNSPYRYSPDRGYVCTFTALIIKSNTAHIFHVGDTRVYRLLDRHLEQLTEDHRLWVSKDKSYLRRALGMKDQLELDYRTLVLDVGDVYVLATDGLYEYVDEKFIIDVISTHGDDLDRAASLILNESLRQGSQDNLTVQIVRVDDLPGQNTDEMVQQLAELPFPPSLQARMVFDGYEIVREVHASSRSHVYLARDTETDTLVVIKTPSVELREDAASLERFLMEEWVARRINNAHVLRPFMQNRKQNYLYVVNEYIDGQTLTQWMIDHPNPDIEIVRDIIEQIAMGLRAFHRREMLHQDLRPHNIMIDRSGTVKIIDFGATRIAGVMEIASPVERHEILGTASYTAPEYFVGETPTTRSDLFSLGVIAYQMLSGRLPYGTHVARARTRTAQGKLNYHSVLDKDRKIPAWIDDTLKKAVHPNPLNRYGELSEFVFDLRHPNRAFLNKTRPPLMERNPVLFWKAVSFILAVTIIILLLDHPVLK